jgi:hypothetical protein
MKNRIGVFSVFMGTCSVLLLLACGGGGGGGSSGTSYTGLTSQASLSQANVDNVAREAYGQGDLTVSAAPILAHTGPGRPHMGSPKALALVSLLHGVVERIGIPSVSSLRPLSSTRANPLAIETVSDTVFDGFGGSASFTVTVDTVTGDFSGTLTFAGWHGEGGGIISGPASFTGNYNQVAGEFTWIRFSFQSATMVDTADSVTITGSVELSITGISASAMVEIYLRDNGTGKTVWIHDYTMTLSEGPDASPADGIPDYTDAYISGRIYLHDYGYVDVSTPTLFRFDTGNTFPSSGTFLVRGSQGRSARLVVIGVSTGYFVEGDLDANGTYEYVSINYPWL